MNEPNLNNLLNEKPKKSNKLVLILSLVIAFLLIVIFIILIVKPKTVIEEKTKKKSLEEVSLELTNYINDNRLDALDAYSFNELTRVAINDICYGVYECHKVSGEAVVNYISKVFNKTVTLTDVNCELNDGVLYTYDSKNNMFVYQSHTHNALVTTPIYTKVNSIKKNDNKYVLTLNKLYYDSTRSDYITTEPTAINRIYNANDYMKMTNDGQDIDITKVKANYDNNFDKLKNKGVKYRYTFVFEDNSYYLEKYEVIESE